MKKFFIILTIFVNINSFVSAQDLPALKGPYLGQKPAGLMPEIFAPGILSTIAHEHSSPEFSPDGKEVYYSVIFPGVQTEVIMFRKIIDGQWSEPEVAPFSGQHRDGSPVYSKDGLKLFFYSMRPYPGTLEPEQMDLWFVEKKQNSWGKPQHLGDLINSNKKEMMLSIAKNGNLYFTVIEKGNHILYKSVYADGKYTAAQSLGKFIGENFAEWCPFIAPDESYLIFSAYELKGDENNDLYIAFRNPDGSWKKPINMGPSINSEFQEQFPKVSPDGKYLFFTSNRFRVERKINEEFFYKMPLTYKKIQEIMNEPGNGRSDIFWVDAKIIEELKITN